VEVPGLIDECCDGREISAILADRVRTSIKQNISQPYESAALAGRGQPSSSAPRISYGVITVCKDSASTIRRTIDSVFRQTVPPREYVFVDGGSRDATVSIVESAIDEARRRAIGTRCSLIHQSNRGITQAWNIGLGALTSDVVCILNSDDWYDPSTVEQVIARFMRHPHAEIVLGSGRYLREAGDAAPQMCRPRPFFVLPFAMTAIHPACFVRAGVYSRVGLFDERYRTAADYDFIYRCRRAGVRFVRAPEIVVNVLRGGFAESNLPLGWREVAEIGRRHARWPILAGAGALARQVFKR
jgi:glycosyltransferase involved in cell wall biosynthesis